MKDFTDQQIFILSAVTGLGLFLGFIYYVVKTNVAAGVEKAKIRADLVAAMLANGKTLDEIKDFEKEDLADKRRFMYESLSNNTIMKPSEIERAVDKCYPQD